MITHWTGKLKHGETFLIALFLGLLLGKIIPSIFLLILLILVCLLGMSASLLQRTNHGAYTRRRTSHVSTVKPVTARHRH